MIHYERRVVFDMAAKTANVTARIQPEIKENADQIKVNN